MRLKTCVTLTRELQTQRPNEIEEMVRAALMKCARECWLGLYETNGFEAKLANGEDVDAGVTDFDDFQESRKQLDKIRAEFVKTSTTFTIKPNHKSRRAPTGAAE